VTEPDPASSPEDPSDADTSVGTSVGPVTDRAITVYWRPGCPFCGSLFRQLEHAQVAHHRVNIWDDEVAAAVVRTIARGNETVPTVTIGDVARGGIGLVNPNVSQILAAVGRV
jgi:mycoredoxin